MARADRASRTLSRLPLVGPPTATLTDTADKPAGCRRRRQHLTMCQPKIKSCPPSSTAKRYSPPNDANSNPLIDHLREVAQGRDDIRVECAGILAGSWFSSGARRGEDLIAAGLLMLAGPVDLDELDR
jgi:hypothetical protein